MLQCEVTKWTWALLVGVWLGPTSDQFGNIHQSYKCILYFCKNPQMYNFTFRYLSKRCSMQTAYVQRLFIAILFAKANHCKQYTCPPENNGPPIQMKIIKWFKNGHLLYFNMERLPSHIKKKWIKHRTQQRVFM